MTEIHTSVKDIEIVKYNKESKACNAAGCNRIGTIELKVPAGKFGDVTLFVCSKCVAKFKDD